MHDFQKEHNSPHGVHTDTTPPQDKIQETEGVEKSSDFTSDETIVSNGTVHSEQVSEGDNLSSSDDDGQNRETHMVPESIDYESIIDFGDDANDVDKSVFADLAHQLGLNASQAQQAWHLIRENHEAHLIKQQEEHAEQNERHQKYEHQLRQQWGHQYDEKIASARQGVLSAGGDELNAVLVDAGIVGHPLVVNAFALIGRQYLEQSSAMGLDSMAMTNHSHNPFHPDTYNLTEQMRLYRDNPSLAQMLERASQA